IYKKIQLTTIAYSINLKLNPRYNGYEQTLSLAAQRARAGLASGFAPAWRAELCPRRKRGGEEMRDQNLRHARTRRFAGGLRTGDQGARRRALPVPHFAAVERLPPRACRRTQRAGARAQGRGAVEIEGHARLS